MLAATPMLPNQASDDLADLPQSRKVRKVVQKEHDKLENPAMIRVSLRPLRLCVELLPLLPARRPDRSRTARQHRAPGPFACPVGAAGEEVQHESDLSRPAQRLSRCH